MAKLERKIKEQVIREMDPETERLFRVNAGLFWAGDVESRLPGGRVVLRGARAVAGAPAGFPDMAGWKTIVVTPEMVGQKIAVFVGIELKSANCDVSSVQQKFGELLTRMGGIFKVVKR